MRAQMLASVARRYASALDEFATMAEAKAPVEKLERRLRVLQELANTWNVLIEASPLRAGHVTPSSTSQGVPVSDRVYVFMREGVMYECICTAKEVSAKGKGKAATTIREFWTIRVNSCEADGPECTGKEFTSADRTEEFENRAVAAVKACQKPCALQRG